MQDKMHVKNVIMSWVTLFDRVNDDPESLTKTVLGVITSPMFLKPHFKEKIMRIKKLNLTFAYERLMSSVSHWVT